MGKLETEFAIGRPAATSADATCSRCNGTGWWSLGRKCFKCGGAGHAERATQATKLRDKRAHIAEVRGMLEQETALLATARFGRSLRQDRIAKLSAQLGQLETEIAALEP